MTLAKWRLCACIDLTHRLPIRRHRMQGKQLRVLYPLVQRIDPVDMLLQ
jgi:hypothetical protein